MNRRQFLQTRAGAVDVSSSVLAAPAQSYLIQRENAKSGTRDWILIKTGVDPKTKYRCPWIESYCSQTSVRAGEKISFYVSANPPSPFTIDIYPIGYYGGDGGRHVLSLVRSKA